MLHLLKLVRLKPVLKSLSHVRLFATHGILYTVPGILQARMLEWVAVPFSRGSSQLRNRTRVSCITVSHSSTLAWKIPWMEEPGRLQSMGSLRVGHD